MKLLFKTKQKKVNRLIFFLDESDNNGEYPIFVKFDDGSISGKNL